MKRLPVPAVLLAFFFLVLTARAETRAVSVTIENPDGPLSESQVTFFIPFDLKPIDLTSNAFFSESTRELKINLGSFADKESKEVRFTLEGPSGRYLLSGKVNGKWPANNSRPEEVFEETISSFAVFLGGEPKGNLFDFLNNLRGIPELVQLADKVTKPGAIVLGAAGLGTIINSAVSASASFAAALSKFFSYLGLGFLRIRRKKPWGRVYNHLTGKPIQGAIVRIIDAQFKKVKETQITDAEGRFGFLVSPGEYYLKVSNRGFTDKDTEMMKVFGPAQTLNLEIALEPLKGELKPASYRALKLLHFFADLAARISPWVLAIGTILSIFNLMLTPGTLSYVIAGLYALLIILKTILHENFFKSFGWILDKNTNQPLSLSVVRIFDTNKNWLLGTRVTDENGRFNFLIGPGDYYLTASKEGYKPFQSASAHFTKAGLISYDIKLEKI